MTWLLRGGDPNAPSPDYWDEVRHLDSKLLEGARKLGKAKLYQGWRAGGLCIENTHLQWGEPAVKWHRGTVGIRFLGALPLVYGRASVKLSTSYYQNVIGIVANRPSHAERELDYVLPVTRNGGVKPELVVWDEENYKLQPVRADYDLLLEQLQWGAESLPHPAPQPESI